jgi:hypothetical protein
VRRALLLTVVALVAMTQPAAAHGETGELEVVEATPDDTGSSVTYRVRLTFTNDGDPVGGATVTATASTVGQAPLPPVSLDAGPDGVYAGTVTFPAPGEWSVRFASADPEAGLTVSYTIEPPPPPTTAPPPSTSEPGPVTSTATDPDLVEETATGGDDGPPAGLVVGLVVTGVLAVAAGITLFVRRRKAEA